MTRRSLTSLLAAVLSVLLVAAPGSQADAAKAKKKKPAAAKPLPKPNAEQVKALSSLAGIYKFGMSKDEVLKTLDKQLTERYEEKIAATNDVYTQDKLRRDKKAELKRVKDSYVEFKGKKTGFDVSIVDDQFRHNTGEAMMVHWETEEGKDQRRFFFFHEGRLYKMFIALSSDAVSGDKNFAFFQSLMEKRFGPGRLGFRTDRDGNQFPSYVEWGTSKIQVRAVDKLGFYGAFCLLIADQKLLKQVDKARTDNPPPEKKPNAVMEAITDSADEDPPLNAGGDTVDTLVKSGGGSKQPK